MNPTGNDTSSFLTDESITLNNSIHPNKILTSVINETNSKKNEILDNNNDDIEKKYLEEISKLKKQFEIEKENIKKSYEEKIENIKKSEDNNEVFLIK